MKFGTNKENSGEFKSEFGMNLIIYKAFQPKIKFLKFQLFICSTDRVMIADLRNSYIVFRGGIWCFGKHKALKPKRGAFFLQSSP